MKKLLLGLFLVVLVMLNFACPDLSSQYGLLMLESPNGEKLYFRREARGLNYDSLSLSKNSDYCSEPNSSTDIIFSGLGPINLFYKFDGDELHLYLTNLVEIPNNFLTKTRIVQHKLNNPEFLTMKKNYKDKGLVMVDVSLDELLICK